MGRVVTYPNPDLKVASDNKPNWNLPDQRRHSFHNLHHTVRYSTSFRSEQVMKLEKCVDMRITERADVQHLTSLPCFSAMVVIRDQHILYERYAADFSPNSLHSIQSINKTMINLIIGKMVEEGSLDLSKPVSHYLPEIGSGYSTATLQQVMDMNVANEYSEDFSNPDAMYYDHEETMGWRLPKDLTNENTMRHFIANIKSYDTSNRKGVVQYKDANPEILGWVAEQVSGKPLRDMLANIVDAAGIENTFTISTDREGVPTMSGGGCFTARDLARYGALFVRRGLGVNGNSVGSTDFINNTAARDGVVFDPAYPNYVYSNQTESLKNGRVIGHGGYGGQYLLMDLHSGVVGVFYSVVENKDGMPTDDYYSAITNMFAEIGNMNFSEKEQSSLYPD